MIALIRDIGTVVVNLDPRLKYARRSFCILEVYAAIDGGAKLVVYTAGWRAWVEHRLALHPIDSAASNTRNIENKEKIDRFIMNTMGFEELDCAVTKAILASFSTQCSSCASIFATVSNLGLFLIWYLDRFELFCLAQFARICLPWDFWINARKKIYNVFPSGCRPCLEVVEPVQTFLTGMCVFYILIAIQNDTSGVVNNLIQLAIIVSIFGGVILLGLYLLQKVMAHDKSQGATT